MSDTSGRLNVLNLCWKCLAEEHAASSTPPSDRSSTASWGTLSLNGSRPLSPLSRQMSEAVAPRSSLPAMVEVLEASGEGGCQAKGVQLSLVGLWDCKGS